MRLINHLLLLLTIVTYINLLIPSFNFPSILHKLHLLFEPCLCHIYYIGYSLTNITYELMRYMNVRFPSLDGIFWFTSIKSSHILCKMYDFVYIVICILSCMYINYICSIIYLFCCLVEFNAQFFRLFYLISTYIQNQKNLLIWDPKNNKLDTRTILLLFLNLSRSHYPAHLFGVQPLCIAKLTISCYLILPTVRDKNIQTKSYIHCYYCYILFIEIVSQCLPKI